MRKLEKLEKHGGALSDFEGIWCFRLGFWWGSLVDQAGPDPLTPASTRIRAGSTTALIELPALSAPSPGQTPEGFPESSLSLSLSLRGKGVYLT